MGRSASIGGKGQPAGSGAAAPVAAAAAQKGAHHALAADAHAQRPVDKALGLDAAVFGNVLDLLQGQLPGQDHPGKAHFGGLFRPRQGVHRHLGAGVEGQVRGHLGRQRGQAQVLYDESIHPRIGGGPDSLGHGGQLLGVDGGVQSHMHPHAPSVTEGHRLLEGIGGEVAGAAPGVEALQAQIHRVGAAEHRRPQHLLVARRGQNLKIHAHLFSSPAASFSPALWFCR